MSLIHRLPTKPATTTEMDFTALSPAEILDLAKPAKEYQEVCFLTSPYKEPKLSNLQLMKTYNHPDLDYDDPVDLLSSLRYFVTLQDKADKPDPEVDEETFYAPTRDGEQLLLKVFRGASTSATPEETKPPLVVLYFGGGFVLGSPTQMVRKNILTESYGSRDALTGDCVAR